MEVLRTPEDRFADVAGYDHAPRYVDVEAGDGSPPLRMAYVDAGPADAPVCLMLHGEPTWGFLYRRVVDAVVAAGFRAVVPDLVGFGRSDKPTAASDHTYARHVGWVTSFLERVTLTGVTLVCQDWGGLIGLRIVARQPDLFAAVVAANTFLPVGDAPSQDFLDWQAFSQRADPPFPVAFVLQNATTTTLPPEVLAAYEAPFPDDSYLAGARVFPVLVPTGPDDPGAVDNRAAWPGLAAFDRPFVTAFSDGDPVTSGGDRVFQRRVAGAAAQPHVTLSGGHFLQEDAGGELGEVVVDTLRRVHGGSRSGNAGPPAAV